MPMTVPNCFEWQAEPGFEEHACYCVKSIGKVWPDCIECGGTGIIGLVPSLVWDDARKKRKMPELTHDNRFDPRGLIADSMMTKPEPVKEKRQSVSLGSLLMSLLGFE